MLFVDVQHDMDSSFASLDYLELGSSWLDVDSCKMVCKFLCFGCTNIMHSCFGVGFGATRRILRMFFLEKIWLHFPNFRSGNKTLLEQEKKIYLGIIYT